MTARKLCKNQTAFKCPDCKSTNHEGEPEFVELVPSYRRVNGVIDGVVSISDASEECWDEAHGQTFSCRNCGERWDLGRVDYESAQEFERRAGRA